MKIRSYKYLTENDIIEKLKNITMLKDGSNFVYKEAYMSIINVNPRSLFPCQYYILKSELDKKIELREEFIGSLRRDIFQLYGGYEFNVDNEPSPRTLIPPVVEESIELDGGIYPLINDGMHRIYLAILLKSNITIIYIRGAKEFYYAYPLPNKWHDVKVVNTIEPNTIKKIHRITDNKKLYRNFDSVFTNCSAPRGLNKGYE